MTRALILDFGGVISRTMFETHAPSEAALDLPAASCVFVDDPRRNVKGARAIGLPIVHFDVADPAAGYTQALHLLGLTKEPTQ